MKAIVVRRNDAHPQVVDIEQPTPGTNEVLVRTLRVGIDGTDHAVIGNDHGGYPEGEDYQILEHEAVGVVEEANGSRFSRGDVVVPTVRRPGESNDYFERGEPDMAPDGQYVERGIDGAHGYMTEYFTSKPEFLVPVPDSFSSHGFLIEPISNSEKAFDHAFASRSAFEWQPTRALVLGNGPLGLLTLAMLSVNDSEFERTYCLGRRDRPDPTIDIIERLGGRTSTLEKHQYRISQTPTSRWISSTKQRGTQSIRSRLSLPSRRTVSEYSLAFPTTGRSK